MCRGIFFGGCRQTETTRNMKWLVTKEAESEERHQPGPPLYSTRRAKVRTGISRQRSHGCARCDEQVPSRCRRLPQRIRRGRARRWLNEVSATGGNVCETNVVHRNPTRTDAKFGLWGARMWRRTGRSLGRRPGGVDGGDSGVVRPEEMTRCPQRTLPHVVKV